MSTTFRIDSASVTVTDPARLSWQEIEAIFPGTLGQLAQTKMRSAIASFDAITPANFNAWENVCDDFLSHTVYLPRRTDADYESSPEVFTYTSPVNSFRGTNNLKYFATYNFHLLTAPFTHGMYLVGAQVLIYMTIRIGVEPAIG